MTNVTDRKAAEKPGSVAVGFPQINLLPPELRASRALARTKRLLGGALVLVLVFAAGIYGVAAVRAGASQSALTDANTTTASLLTEKSKYSEVTAVLQGVERAKTARIFATSTEVQWADYLQAISAVAPQQASIQTVTIESATPLAPMAAPIDVLSTVSLARITFTWRVLVSPDASAWLVALEGVPGLANPTITSVTVAGDDTTPVFYDVVCAVQVTDVALAKRFVAGQEN